MSPERRKVAIYTKYPQYIHTISIYTKDLFKYFDSWSVFPHLFGDNKPILTSLKFDIPKRRFRTKKHQ